MRHPGRRLNADLDTLTAIVSAPKPDLPHFRKFGLAVFDYIGPLQGIEGHESDPLARRMLRSAAWLAPAVIGGGLAGVVIVVILLYVEERGSRRLQALLRKVEMLRSENLQVLDSAAEGIVRVATDGKIVFLNRAALQMTERNEFTEVLGAPLREWIAHHGPGKCPVLDGDAAGTRHCSSDTWRHGEIPLETWAHSLNGDESGAASQVITFVDASAERAAERKLRLSEEEYRRLFERHPQPMWIRDRENSRFLAVNDAAVRHYGYPRQQFLCMSLRDLVRPEDWERVFTESLPVAAHPYRLCGVWQHKRADGSWLDMEVSISDISFAGRPARLTLCNDVTERARLEEQLRQAQKMESLGRLAGGVAHDFNNLLTVINGYTELLLPQAEKPASRAALEQIQRAGESASALTRQLLAFSRRQVVQKRPLNLNETLAGLRKMLGRLIGENIELDIKLAPDLPLIYADPGQIEQIVINLAVNARDAMPRGGSLQIATAPAELDGAAGAPAGKYAQVTVSDTGGGMTEEVRRHLFEPIFTTKAPGKGTGLGLAIVYGIVKQIDGRIEVYSEPGHGAVFKLWFPVHAHAAAET